MSSQTLDQIISEPNSQDKLEVNKNHLRLYEHNLCPFCTRVRYVYALKEVEYQNVQMDLSEKAQWHVDFNGGSTAVLETPAGDLIKESAVIAQVGIEMNAGKGVDVIPKDPIQAAKMRLQIEECNTWMMPIYQVYGSRGEDPEKVKNLIPTLQKFNELIKKADGKFMFGTDEPTLLDCWFTPFLETFTDWRAPNVMNNVLVESEYDVNGSEIDAYVNRMRSHPKLKPVYMNTAAAAKHWERTRGWEKGVKCQLTVSYLAEAFKSHP